ncbi:MAG: serine/threonine-protein phosphatase, partial [Prolixibacteraceae bacterium]|nr:serine/threonine-protein phosphatase [Prolixibacteraceae bacterium]
RFEIIDNDQISQAKTGWYYVQKQHGSVEWKFTTKINDNKYITCVLDSNWIESLLSEIGFVYPYEYFFYNEQNKVIASNNHLFIDNSVVFKNNSKHINISEEYAFVNKVKAGDNSKLYKTITTEFESLQINFAISHPESYVFEHLGRYVALILLVVAFLLVLMIGIINRTNKRMALTFNDILQTISRSKYLNINQKSTNYDLVLIKRSIESLINQLNFYEKKLDTTLAKNQKIENDIEIAKKLQKSILPKYIQQKSLLTNKVQIATLYDAAYDIGGDLYDYFMLDDSHLLLAVGDISGKGIPASLFMIYTQTLLRSIAKSRMSVAEIADELNNRLSEGNTSELFVTMLIGILNVNTGELSYCNAAHNLPLIIRQEGTIEELSETHGIPMGIYPNKSYTLSNIKLNYHDYFLIFTDGVVDTKDENGMNFSVEVLKYNLMGSWFLTPNEIAEKINHSILSFRGNIPPADDMTMLVLQYQQQEEQ